MTRRLALLTVPPTESDEVFDAKQKMVDAICKKLEDVNTFTSIAKIVGYSRLHVANLMKKQFTDDDWFHRGDDYRIPRGTAEKFVRTFYQC